MAVQERAEFGWFIPTAGGLLMTPAIFRSTGTGRKIDHAAFKEKSPRSVRSSRT